MLYSYQNIFPLAAKPLTKICSRRNHEMNYSKFEIVALKKNIRSTPTPNLYTKTKNSTLELELSTQTRPSSPSPQTFT